MAHIREHDEGGGVSPMGCISVNLLGPESELKLGLVDMADKRDISIGVRGRGSTRCTTYNKAAARAHVQG